ncbi:hypothetical protein F0365_09545 [Nonlabens sp. Ci31]|jgi:hypothetical protein|uniref:hypothetical protein n=1 Tax=Nonlabens sp. Ci31 TaxID=2608253 RepID=UPI0014645FB7|nr:hypothetical protein [Nonlabens sp. Ci31]QJP34617.1 hypothetical protein F0365_09545 [Nonlabens sp. Ci31]
MKTMIITTVLICSLAFTSAQNQNHYQVFQDSVNTDSYQQEICYLKVGVGYWLPKGNLSKFIDNSPLFELALVIPDTKRNRAFELGIQLAVPEQKDFFILSDGVDQFDVEATSVVNAYLKLNKYVYKKSKGRLGLGISVGISSIFLDPVESSGAEVLDYDSVNSVLVAPGLSYDYTLNDNSMFQISLDVQYTPFKMERAVTRRLNSFNILPKVSYRF